MLGRWGISVVVGEIDEPQAALVDFLSRLAEMVGDGAEPERRPMREPSSDKEKQSGQGAARRALKERPMAENVVPEAIIASLCGQFENRIP